jgi:hypothetical protein
MHGFKIHRKLKGETLIYVLYIGLLCISMSVLALSMEVKRTINHANIKKYEDNLELSTYYREKLFSQFYESLIQSNLEVSQSYVDSYIAANPSLLWESENSKLYFKGDKIIILRYPYDEYHNKFECYKIQVISGKLRFIKVQAVVLDKGNDL